MSKEENQQKEEKIKRELAVRESQIADISSKIAEIDHELQIKTQQLEELDHLKKTIENSVNEIQQKLDSERVEKEKTFKKLQVLEKMWEKKLQNQQNQST